MTVFVLATTVTMLLLVIAVVGLFAMMGELAARLGNYVRDDDATALPLEGARIGIVPRRWPNGVAHLATAETSIVLVLSPLCSSCSRIAATMAGHAVLRQLGPDFALVISCASAEVGQRFLRQHRLSENLPSALDVNGEWLIDEFAVDTSPTMLVFRKGRLQSAAAIASMAAVAAIVPLIESKEEDDGASGSRPPDMVRSFMGGSGSP